MTESCDCKVDILNVVLEYNEKHCSH